MKKKGTAPICAKHPLIEPAAGFRERVVFRDSEETFELRWSGLGWLRMISMGSSRQRLPDCLRIERSFAAIQPVADDGCIVCSVERRRLAGPYAVAAIGIPATCDECP